MCFENPLVAGLFKSACFACYALIIYNVVSLINGVFLLLNAKERSRWWGLFIMVGLAGAVVLLLLKNKRDGKDETKKAEI